tara:strand:- start:5196 stop:5810 length:615 start_codon:yes stop_codon:yes gene_type:complete
MESFSLMNEKSKLYGEINDCTVKAAAVVMATTYEDAHNMCMKAGRKFGKGMVTYQDLIPAIKQRGFRVTEISTSAKTIRTLGRVLPRSGQFLIRVRGHVAGVSDGRVNDWSEGRCHRILNVWRVEEVNPVRYTDATVSTTMMQRRKKPVTRKARINYELYDTRTGRVVKKYSRRPKFLGYPNWKQTTYMQKDPSTKGNLEIRRV